MCSPFPKPPGKWEDGITYLAPGELRFIAACADCGHKAGEWWVGVAWHEAVFLCTPCVWTRRVVPFDGDERTESALWALVLEHRKHPLEWRRELAAVLARYARRRLLPPPAEWAAVIDEYEGD